MNHQASKILLHELRILKSSEGFSKKMLSVKSFLYSGIDLRG